MDDIQPDRPVGSGAAWRRSPHQKSAERKREKGEKRKTREERKRRLINNELREISNWFKANKLSVNASKTNYMMLGTSHMTNKYIDVKKYCDANDTDNATNERSSKQKINVILDSVSLERFEVYKVPRYYYR